MEAINFINSEEGTLVEVKDNLKDGRWLAVEDARKILAIYDNSYSRKNWITEGKGCRTGD